METAVIVPAYNEARRLGGVIENIILEGYEPIVVDDGSKDKTTEVAIKNGATVLTHVINLGKGAAAKTGCDYAIKNGAKKIVLIDADGQHKPKDIKRITEKLKENNSIVFSYRKLNKKMPLMMRIGNKVINELSTRVNGIKIKDTQCGFRAMNAETYKKIRWNSSDYGMESEMIAKAAKKKIQYSEIPIETIYHDTFKGTTIFDGLRIVLRIMKWKLI